MGSVLSRDELSAIDAYWRAANYLSVGQIYLLDNPLLRQPLTPEHIKPRLLGHWGTTPGLNFIYAHLNRAIRKYDLDMIYVCGPGHGGPGMVANTYLEGTYSELYPNISQDAEGIRRLFKQFSFPGGIPSHATLTEGKPRLVSVGAADGTSETEVLALAAGLERGSEHPLAAAILAGATERGVLPAEVTDFQSLTGRGVAGMVAGRRVALGNARLLEELGVKTGTLGTRAESLRKEGQTVMFLAAADAVTGILGVADPIKATTPEAIRSLHAEGLRVVMLTGDSRVTAEAVARTLGLDDVIAEVLPEQKTEVVRKLQEEGRVVVMAGDGVNDAPALAQAEVGIAMGTGTDVAMESAGVTLVKGDLRGIVRARRLSRATMRNIRQNLVWAFIYNVLGVPVAAGVLYPVFGLLLSPTIASAAMSLSSVSVIVNALRLRRVEL